MGELVMLSKNKIVVGLMSGTALDGVDVALLSVLGKGTTVQYKLIAFDTYPYDQALKDRILQASQIDTSNVALITELHYELGVVYSRAIQKLLDTIQFKQPLDLIGLHGQTIHHLPNALYPSTLQIGNASKLAYDFETTVVSNFREMDLVAGGEGAPLVPYIDYVLYRDDTQAIGLQNIGGIANLTLIPKKASSNFNRYGLRSAAFVTSQTQGSFGPWPVTDGLVTLEIHRNLPLEVQIKHLIAMNVVDDIIISNCYPSDEELKKVKALRLDRVMFQVELVDSIPEIERKIVLESLHFNRGDVNDHMIRSTQSRVKYKGHQFEVFNTPKTLQRGDVIIESSLYGHYAGELQIVKQSMVNSGMSNVVGKINEREHFLLDDIEPWQKFGFVL